MWLQLPVLITAKPSNDYSLLLFMTLHSMHKIVKTSRRCSSSSKKKTWYHLTQLAAPASLSPTTMGTPTGPTTTLVLILKTSPLISAAPHILHCQHTEKNLQTLNIILHSYLNFDSQWRGVQYSPSPQTTTTKLRKRCQLSWKMLFLEIQLHNISRVHFYNSMYSWIIYAVINLVITLPGQCGQVSHNTTCNMVEHVCCHCQ